MGQNENTDSTEEEKKGAAMRGDRAGWGLVLTSAFPGCPELGFQLLRCLHCWD